jgi:hypothetical protein
MTHEMEISICPATGFASVHIADDDLGDLLEYLSWHRVAANYIFEPRGYRVLFPHSDPEVVRKLMDGWLMLQEWSPAMDVERACPRTDPSLPETGTSMKSNRSTTTPARGNQ